MKTIRLFFKDLKDAKAQFLFIWFLTGIIVAPIGWFLFDDQPNIRTYVVGFVMILNTLSLLLLKIRIDRFINNSSGETGENSNICIMDELPSLSKSIKEEDSN